MATGRRVRRGRPRDAGKKAALRERVVEYVLAHGLADLSLRPLARALGTSARMLVYHFGSRERLLVAVLESLREREDARIERWWTSGPGDRSLAEFVRWYGRLLGSPKARPALRLVYEIYAMALREPRRFPGVLESPVAYWNRLTRRGGGRAKGPDLEAKATLGLAAMRGLLLDLAATGERARVARAVERLARSLEA